MYSYNGNMKTKTEIQIKKIRKRLKLHTLTDEEKTVLRNTLEYLKSIHKVERVLVEDI